MLPIKILNLLWHKESVKMPLGKCIGVPSGDVTGKRREIRGEIMKRSIFAATFLGLLTSGLALAQDRPTPTSQPDQPVARPAAARSLSVFGKVSSDGRSLFTDLDTEWTVSNAEILKGREGSLVTVKCYVDPDRNQIHVLSVRPARSEVKYASRQGDSAFRR
jgi:hypothetical protein